MKSASLSKKAYALLMFAAVSVLSGLLLAGLAVPFVALIGGGTRVASDSLKYLPAELETPPQSQRSQILMANGKVLATFYDENRIYVKLEKISQAMQDAQVAIEDHRFYEHGAIDLQGLGRAVIKTLTGDTQGASTLTQQYVKLVQLEAAVIRDDQEAQRAATEVSIERKIREMRYAMAVEERMSKKQILEGYLNIAYYGNGAYGVESAARFYFGVKASKLNLAQSAMLAGIVQNPGNYNPLTNTETTLERRNFVLQRMADVGAISQAEADEAKKETFDPEDVKRTPNGCVSSKFPFVCDYVQRTLLDTPSLGETREQRENLLKRGGLTIRTLIDPAAQKDAEKAVAKLVSPKDPVVSGTVLLQPSTGLIVAMAQSRPKMGDGKGETYYNLNVEQEMGGLEGYQAGSTFKPFVLAAALEMGYTPKKQYNAPGKMQFRGQSFKDCKGSFPFNQDWDPGNQGNVAYGLIDMMKATQSSVNTYFIQLERDVGICASIDAAQAMGVKRADGVDMRKEARFPAWVLGTSYVTPLSMAEAYATLANRGVHCKPIILESITTADGRDLKVPSADCERVIPKGVADGVTYILESVIAQGTGKPARIPDWRPQAGKTGTTNEFKSVWFAGYTPDLAGVAFIAVDTGPASKKFWKGKTQSLRNKRLETGYWLRGTGGGDAGAIWKAAMSSALEDTPKTKFKQPPKVILEGKKVKIPSTRGMGLNEAKRVLEKAGFTAVVSREHSDYAEGTFLGTSPYGEAIKFSTIYLRVSMGKKPEPPPPPTKPDDEKKPDDKKDDDKKSDDKTDDKKDDKKDKGD
ncbi:transglycosylase domain-containing protein [Tessaracoccus caeni]|uniref:transglycosylase domain-containing protein n=1 Tax=Tessaracoccus caeni TaxID=3031239 RepID=UPI0023DC54A0|nr:transglycosylase domain-containing protein [Tessaracoccus caeni]MDF1490066.1 transglycosylase domain-containing protein [Tessaracoccus caeni]